MTFTKPFNQLGKNDAAIAGGKGASLGEMTQAGIPVPPGFVILAGAFERFIIETSLTAEIDAILEKVDHREMHTVEHASETIQALILDAEMPTDLKAEIKESFKDLNTEFVAVRSSATAEDGAEAAWAGQLDTFLNTTHETLLEKVRECWASLFTPRAIFYRFEKGMHAQKISVAVVVQKMVNSDAAGIAFSVHPVTEDRNQMIIEAGFGLGEAVVSGQVTPDSYVVTKEPRAIIEKSISEQAQGIYRKEGGGNEWKDLPKAKGGSQVLTDSQILLLAEVLITIENHYGFPVDTEWAMESEQMFIVQSRPITTLVKESPTPFVSEELKDFDSKDWHHFGLWPQGLFSAYFWGTWFDKDLFKRFGLLMEDPGVLIFNGGHFFYKKSVLEQLQAHVFKYLEGTDDFLLRYRKEAEETYLRCVEFARTLNVDEITVERFDEFLTHARDITAYWCFAAVHLQTIVERALQKKITEHQVPAEAIPQLIPQIHTPLFEQQRELKALKKKIGSSTLDEIRRDASLLSEMQAHLGTYAWIEIANWVGEELTLERLFNQIEHTSDSSESVQSTVKMHADLRYVAESFAAVGYAKQAGAEYLSMYSQLTRPFLNRITEQLGITYEELMATTHDEIRESLSTGISAELKLRIPERQKGQWFVEASRGRKAIFTDDHETISRLMKDLLPKEDVSAKEFKGDIANGGLAKGVAKVVRNVEEFSKLQTGEILVTTMTTPDFVILMQKAAAIITDTGGLLSHAAIVSRELNKPCVIGTKIATKAIHDGDLVEVDADKGVVRILTSKEKILLTKSFSREHSLFYTYPWRISNCEYGERWLDRNIQDALYVRPCGTKVVEVWYGIHLFDTYHADITAQIEKDATWFPRLVDSFEEEWNSIYAYIKKEDHLTKDELADFYQHWINWWEPMAIMMELPEVQTLPEDTRKKAYDLRAKTQEYSAASDTLYLKYIERAHPELSEYFSVLAPDEVFADNFPPEHILKERINGWFLTSNEFHLIEDLDKVLAERHFVLEKPDVGQRELKGQSAYKGTVRGRVRIVLQKDQVASVQEGEIIVSPMTTPEFMPALQKATAFVTDEGGITCHAAIIARELQKPCITGTKFATQVLHDGDEVEVDANVGVVKILKSNNAVRHLSKNEVVISDWEFEAQQRGEQPIFLCDLFSRSLDQLIFDMTGEESHYDYLFTDSDKLNHSPRHRDIVLKKLREDMFDRTKREEFLRNSIEIPKSFNAVANEVEAKVSDTSISNKELAKLWRDMDRDFLKVIPWFYYPWYVSKENMLTDQVKVGLEKHRKEIEKICDVDEALLAIVFPVKKTNFQLEQDEMLGLVTAAEMNPDFANDSTFKKLASEYLKKYDYLTTFILTPVLPMTYDQLVERVSQNVRESFKENYSLQKEATQKNEERARQILEVIKGDKEIMPWVEDSRELGYVLTAGIEEAYMSSARYLKFIQLIAERIGVTFEDTKYLLSNEIATALEEDEKIPAALIDERRRGFVLMIKDGIQYASFGKEGHELSSWIDGELNKVDTTIKEFTGQRACKGYAKGKVRIATTPSQAHLLEEGEILVCPMTNPDYVPAMRRSAAIITDEGGLLSHAAIMSREFGKPCVIATKIATQLLKTGDVVEVDADNGIVRILESGTNDVPPVVRASDYEFTFESEGTTLLFEDICCTHYMPDDSFELGYGSVVQTYCAKSTIQKMQKTGEYQTTLDIKETVSSFKLVRSQVETETAKYQQKQDFTLDDAKYMFSRIGSLFKDYFLFDFNHWDTVYEHAKDNPLMQEKVELVERYKNELRADLDPIMFGETGYYKTLLKRICEKAKISSKDIDWYREAEVYDLFDGKFTTPTEITARKKSWVLYRHGTCQLYSGATAELIIESLTKRVSTSKTLEGKVAHSTGKNIEGKVRVIKRDYGDPSVLRKCITEMGQGDILVSQSTDPELIKAMKKAGAIITDVGGMLSHAAITARELNIPCIVGTQVASKVLKDGDQVSINIRTGKIST